MFKQQTVYKLKQRLEHKKKITKCSNIKIKVSEYLIVLATDRWAGKPYD